VSSTVDDESVRWLKLSAINLLKLKGKKILIGFTALIFAMLSAVESYGGNLHLPATLLRTRIGQSAQDALIYLKRHQHENGAISLTRQSAFDVWETIQAARALALWQADMGLPLQPIVKAALHFLKKAETPQGLVLHSSLHKNSYCVETTSDYIRLLALLVKQNLASPMDVIQKTSYLIKGQLPSGAWKIENPTVPDKLQIFPSVTGFALCAIAAAETEPLNLKAAIHYLKSTQTDVGHWGFAPPYYGTPFYVTSPVLTAFKSYPNAARLEETIQKGRAFLLSCQQKDGGFLDNISQNEPWPSPELQTILALTSLLQCNVTDDLSAISKGLNWLLDRQRPDGSWNGGWFPMTAREAEKKEDIYCTSLVLVFLKEFLLAGKAPPLNRTEPSIPRRF